MMLQLMYCKSEKCAATFSDGRNGKLLLNHKAILRLSVARLLFASSSIARGELGFPNKEAIKCARKMRGKGLELITLLHHIILYIVTQPSTPLCGQ